jgi:hypothetical protein
MSTNEVRIARCKYMIDRTNDAQAREDSIVP